MTMGSSIPSEVVRAETLFAVRVLREITGFKPDGKPWGIVEACAECGLGVNTYYKHRRENTPEWQGATAAIDELCRDEALISEAKARVSRLLTSGQDGPAAMVATRLLGLAEHTKADVTADVRAREWDAVRGNNGAAEAAFALGDALASGADDAGQPGAEADEG